MRLPDELLVEVFQNVIDDEQGSLRCIPLSQSCRRWRDAALSAPVLWSVIITDGKTSEAVLELLLRRAGPVLLDVHFFDSYPYEQEGNFDYDGMVSRIGRMFVRLVSQLSRIRHLEINVRDKLRQVDLAIMAVDLALPLAAPNLWSAKFLFGTEEIFEAWPCFGAVPVLNHVTMMCTSFDSLLPFLPSTLTSLQIDCGPDDQEQQIAKLPDLLTALCSMPFLQELIMFLSLSFFEPIPTSTRVPPVKLHSLKRLVLGGLCPDLVWMMDHIRGPGDVDVQLDLTSRRYASIGHTGLHTITDDILQEFTARLATAVTSMPIDKRIVDEMSYAVSFAPRDTVSFALHDPRDSYHFHLFSRAHDNHITYLPSRFSGSQPHGQLTITLMPAFLATEQDVAIWDTLPLDRVQTVEMTESSSHGTSPASQDGWFLDKFGRCAERMCSVEKVILHRWNVVWIWELLLAVFEGSSDGIIFFPNLKQLVLDQVSLGPRSSSLDDSAVTDVSRSSAQKTGAQLLRDALLARQKKCRPLDKITLVECRGMTSGDMAAMDFGGAVVKVISRAWEYYGGTDD